jgi:phage protein D
VEVCNIHPVAAMIFEVRRARPEITISGKDYFSKLAPYFLSMSYTDNCDGKKADDLEITLADRDKRFISDWMPSKGTFIDAAIIAERWFSPNAGGLKLDCGRFWIDSIEFTLPDHTVSIKGSSIPTDANIKGTDETRGWEKTTLQDVANQIAQENKMTVKWEADHNPRYSRIEQVEESGLAFLKKRAEDAKLAIKVCRGQIIFFDEKTYESKAPAMTIVYGDTAGGPGLACYRMTGGHFSTQLTDKVKKATVTHASVKTGKTSTGEAESEDEEIDEDQNPQNVSEGTDDADEDAEEGGGGSLREGGLVSSWGESGSNLKAESVVRNKNKDKENARIELSIGNPLIAAGTTFVLKGVGQYDGNYFIVSAHHVCGPEFKTELDVRRCLKGI